MFREDQFLDNGFLYFFSHFLNLFFYGRKWEKYKNPVQKVEFQRDIGQREITAARLSLSVIGMSL